MRKRRLWIAALSLLLFFAVLPQIFSLNVFRGAARRALERELGRAVEFEAFTVSFLPRPGLVGQRFVLHESEKFGAEPFLFARELRCYFPLRVLWRWRLECSQLSLFEPSLNLVRNDAGEWNLGAFFQGAGNPGGEARGSHPLVTAIGGRVNFKSGANKFRYSLSDVRFRLAPQTEGHWSMELEASPMRTDRRLGEIGRVRLNGELTQAGEGREAHFQLEGALEKGSLAPIWEFVQGEDAVVRARIAGQFQLEGTPESWSGSGNLSVDELRRWDLLPDENIPRWETEFTVRYSDADRELEFEEVVLRAPKSEIHAVVRLRDPLGERDWNLEATSAAFDLGEWHHQLSKLTTIIPPGTRLTGLAQFSFRGGGDLKNWEGEFSAPQPVSLLSADSGDEVKIENFHLGLAIGRLELQPLSLSFATQQNLTLNGSVRLDRENYPYRMTWKSEGVPVEAVESAAAALGWVSPSPGLVQGQAAVELEWTGNLTGSAATRWSGNVELRGARLSPSEFAEPLFISHAKFSWRRGRLRIDPLDILLGGNRVSVRLEKRLEDVRWNAQVSAERLKLSDLTGLFISQERNLLGRLVEEERPRQIPWDKFWVAGQIKVDELEAGTFRLNRVNARAEFRMARLEISRLRFRAHKGEFDGSFRGDFLESPPKYRLVGNVRKFQLGDLLALGVEGEPVLSGLLGAEVLFETSGVTASQIWENLSGAAVGGLQDGTYASFDLMAALQTAAGVSSISGDGSPQRSSTSFQSLAGAFRLSNRRLEADDARLIFGGAAWSVNGRAGFDGALDFEITGQPLSIEETSPATARLFDNKYRLRGTLFSPRIELAPPADTGSQ